MIADDIWYILQWIIFIFLLVIPIYFYIKAKTYKRDGNVGGRAFSLGYCFFFLINSINQFFYLMDQDLQLRFFLRFHEIWGRKLLFTLLVEIDVFTTHITIMVLLLFLAFIPIIFPMEKYIQRWEKKPVTKLLIISSIFISILWTLFCLIGLPQPILTNTDFLYALALFYEIIIHILAIIAFITIIVSILTFIYFYIKLAFQSPGIVRRKALIIAFGILFMYISLIVGNLSKPSVEGTWLVMIGPIALISGILILVYGFSIKIM